MSTDEYSQDNLSDELYQHRTPSAASSSYPNLGSSSSCSLPMPGNIDVVMMARSQQHQQQQVIAGQDQVQRQKRKYTRRKQPEERKKRGPRAKDLNAPRMPLNGYVRFLNANRERIKQENPDLTFAEVTKKLASQWSSMSSDEKKAYLDEAERAKEMYLKELHEYQKTNSYQEFLSLKQRAKQQQHHQQPPSSASTVNSSHSMIHSQSDSSMPVQSSSVAMYSTNNSHSYGYGEMTTNGQSMSQHGPYSTATSMLHPQQQSYSYVMNSKLAPCSSTSAAYAQQPHHQPPQHQQFYQSSSHSSAASDYCNLPSFNQLQNRFHSPYSNQVNGITCHSGIPNDVNNSDFSEPLHGGDYGINSLSNVLDNSSVPVLDLPIYTEEFLEHNKMREQELRNYRAITMEYEEENAILSKHVDDMTAATEKLIQDEAKERETNGRLKAVLEKLQQNFVEHFQDVDLPQSYWPQSSAEQCYEHQMPIDASSNHYGRVSLGNIDQFMLGLDNLYAQSGGDATFATCKSTEPLVQSIQSAISSLDEVIF